jgi:flagellar hook-associated protein 2
MSISAAGIGSGIDIDGLVRQLLAAEGQPATARLNQREAKLQGRLSAFGQFRSALEQLRTALGALKDPSKFMVRTATAGNEELLSASATSDAAPGVHDVEVVRLATAHKLASAPVATAASVVGSGTLTITVGGASFAVDIDAGAASLADIRNAVNGSADNTGVTATLVTANDGVRLVLTGTATGATNTITVTESGGDGGLAAIAYDPGNGVTGLAELQAAGDSQVVIDGFVHDGASNQVSDAVTGLTLRLLSAAPGLPTTLTVGDDGAASAKLVNDFVTAYNAVIKTTKDLTHYNAATKSAAALLGDPTLRGFASALRNAVASPFAGGGSFTALFELGVTTQVDGTLEVDAGRLGEALAEGYSAVSAFFGAEEAGLAQRLDALLDGYLDDEGVLDGRTDSLRSGIEDVTTAREALDRRLEQVEARLRAQFTALDTLVAQMKNTGDFLNRQLSALMY